jgi:hypothetical protein
VQLMQTCSISEDCGQFNLDYYSYDNIDGQAHITNRPAEASFQHENSGDVDYIWWVTMIDDGCPFR